MRASRVHFFRAAVSAPKERGEVIYSRREDVSIISVRGEPSVEVTEVQVRYSITLAYRILHLLGQQDQYWEFEDSIQASPSRWHMVKSCDRAQSGHRDILTDMPYTRHLYVRAMQDLSHRQRVRTLQTYRSSLMGPSQ